MSSCREIIEWDYGDVGRYWNLVDYKKVLKMRQMRVDEMYLVAMILRNAYVTVSANNTCSCRVCLVILVLLCRSFLALLFAPFQFAPAIEVVVT